MIGIIPKSNLQEKVTIQKQANKTYKLNIQDNIIEGTCDDLEAIKQTIYCILNTERFEYLVYSWNYGVELKNLIGEAKTFVIPELERVIKEALMQDDRIADVVDFKFIQKFKNNIILEFKVLTLMGDVNIEKEVSL